MSELNFLTELNHQLLENSKNLVTDSSFYNLRASVSLPKVGKSMISKLKNSPAYGFGSSHRFSDLPTNINDQNYTPGPIYESTDRFKFYKSPVIRFTNEKRDWQSKEKYDYYKYPSLHRYEEHKKWAKTIGGAIQLDKRSDLALGHSYPGPGNYSPELNNVLTKSPKYSIGVKLGSSLVVSSGATNKVGPGSYNLNNLQTFKLNSPKWSIPNDTRKGICNYTASKNDTYFVINACDKQVSSIHKSEPRFTFPKSDRESQNKLLFFNK